MSIRIGIFGYGNLGRGVEAAMPHNPDMKLVGVFTRRAPDTVYVALGLKRQLHIDYAGYVRHINAAAGDIGRNKDARLPAPEPLKRACTLVLSLVGVDRRAGNTGAEKFLDDAVGAVAHLRKDDNFRPFGMLRKKMLEQIVLLGLFDEHHLLVDLFNRGRLGRNRDLHRIAHELAGELQNLRRKRSREKERLTCLGQLGDDTLDVGQEPHVEHAVRLVEHEALHLIEIDYALCHQVDKAARACDYGFRTLLDILDLPKLTDPAKDARKRQLGVLRVGADILGCLRGEFARRRKDKRARMANMTRTAMLDKVVQDRQHECRRLSGAGLRTADKIAPLEKMGHSLLLDGRRGFVAGVGDRMLKLLVERAENGSFKHGASITRSQCSRKLQGLSALSQGHNGISISRVDG